MKTKEFRTRQEFFKDHTHPKGKDFIIGLDAGYSSVKVFYENGYFCFPYYVKKIEGGMLGVANDKDIMYKDLTTNEIYMLGTSAQEMISSTDTNDMDGESFSRKRFGNPKFKIACNAALGLAMLENKDQKEVFVSTGLPSAYVDSADKGDLIRTLSKPAHFAIKRGNGNWREVNLNLKQEQISVMPQPAGSFYSVLLDKNGKYIPTAKNFWFKNVLVIDIGFGTFDLFSTQNRMLSCKESDDQLGMKQVLKKTSDKIFKTMGEDIRIQALQKNLETGEVICMTENEDGMPCSEAKPFENLLEEASNEVFKEAMSKVKNSTNSFRDYDYIIIAGGTGEAWFGNIQNYLSGLKNVQLIKSNANDGLPMLYSNVRGYYFFRLVSENRTKK